MTLIIFSPSSPLNVEVFSQGTSCPASSSSSSSSPSSSPSRMHFPRGPAVLHHRAVRNAASETARPVKASKELYLLKRYKCHSTPVYPILDNYSTHQVKYKHRLSQHNNPTNTQMTDCWRQVIPATAPPPPSLMAPQFSTGEGES